LEQREDFIRVGAVIVGAVPRQPTLGTLREVHYELFDTPGV
jgi:hypothetical protein